MAGRPCGPWSPHLQPTAPTLTPSWLSDLLCVLLQVTEGIQVLMLSWHCSCGPTIPSLPWPSWVAPSPWLPAHTSPSAVASPCPSLSPPWASSSSLHHSTSLWLLHLLHWLLHSVSADGLAGTTGAWPPPICLLWMDYSCRIDPQCGPRCAPCCLCKDTQPVAQATCPVAGGLWGVGEQ